MPHRKREPVPGVYRLILPLPFPGLDRVNAFLLAAEAGHVMVDAGIWNPGAEDGGYGEVVAALAASGASVPDVAKLVITHPHVDHVGMAARIVEESDCALSMHERAVPELRRYEHPRDVADQMRKMLSEHGVSAGDAAELTSFEDMRAFVPEVRQPSEVLHGGETMMVGDRSWEVLHAPGHDAGHICLWAPEARVLISGDTLLGSITPHIDFGRDGAESGDPLRDFLDTLRRIEELDPALVLPGHGRPFEGGAERARAIARHHDRRLGAILQVVRRGPRTASEITDEIFGAELLDFQRRLALGEALAHLVYLSHEGDIERVRTDDGTFAYRKKSRSAPSKDE